jgi:hypothetical protein
VWRSKTTSPTRGFFTSAAQRAVRDHAVISSLEEAAGKGSFNNEGKLGRGDDAAALHKKELCIFPQVS